MILKSELIRYFEDASASNYVYSEKLCNQLILQCKPRDEIVGDIRY